MNETFSTAAVQLGAVLLGGLLALAGGLAGTYLTAALTRKHRRESLAAALAGEMGAIIDLVKRRDYLAGLNSLIAHVEVSGGPAVFYFNIRNNYFRVYEANVHSIGLLPADLAEGVVRFYSNCYAFLKDVADFREGMHDPLVQGQSLERLRGMRALLEDSMPLAEKCRSDARVAAGLLPRGDPSKTFPR